MTAHKPQKPQACEQHHQRLGEEAVKRWLKTYPFLSCKTEGTEMAFYCTVCVAQSKKNSLTVGQKTNFQQNTWVRHMKTRKQCAVAEKQGKSDFQRARNAAAQRQLEQLRDKEGGDIALMKIMNALPVSLDEKEVLKTDTLQVLYVNALSIRNKIDMLRATMLSLDSFRVRASWADEGVPY